MSISSKSYTKQEDDFLIKNYPIIVPTQCSQHLGRTYRSVVSHACRSLHLLSNKFKHSTNPLNKICGRCLVEKPKNLFGADKNRKDGYNCLCKECLFKERSSENCKNKKRLYDKKFRIENIAKIKEYEFKNKLKIRQRATVYQRKWRQIPRNRILQNLRTRIRMALKHTKKAFRTIESIGCSIDFLKKYLESKFQPGMNWQNHSKTGWHIDHIIPCSSFDLTIPEEQKKCFHYTNLQPLWAKDNLSKGNKILATNITTV